MVDKINHEDKEKLQKQCKERIEEYKNKLNSSEETYKRLYDIKTEAL